jgi:hypothetical protein
MINLHENMLAVSRLTPVSSLTRISSKVDATPYFSKPIVEINSSSNPVVAGGVVKFQRRVCLRKF